MDSDTGRAEALAQKLRDSGFAAVESLRTPGAADLADAVDRLKPDLVIVDMALPDRDTLEGIRAVSDDRPIVMFAGSDDPAFAEEAIAAGVCSYNLSGVALADVRPILSAAIALFRRHRRVESELMEAKAKLDERRLVERAKAILMQGRRMSEPEAYRWLQKRAMDENRKLAEVVVDVIESNATGLSAPGRSERKAP